jgi:hypothetical protein
MRTTPIISDELLRAVAEKMTTIGGASEFLTLDHVDCILLSRFGLRGIIAFAPEEQKYLVKVYTEYQDNDFVMTDRFDEIPEIAAKLFQNFWVKRGLVKP